MAEKGRIGRILESMASPFRRRRTPEPQVTIGKRSFTKSAYSVIKNINTMLKPAMNVAEKSVTLSRTN